MSDSGEPGTAHTIRGLGCPPSSCPSPRSDRRLRVARGAEAPSLYRRPDRGSR
jgi:hypothetical protein